MGVGVMTAWGAANATAEAKTIVDKQDGLDGYYLYF